MRVTGVGHAGMRFETTGGSVLCDPWVNPTFFASWVPFPDNTQLDWSELGRTDYLYVSHLHRDHFDADNLREHVSKDARVLLPDYPTDELEHELRELGFRHFIRTETGVPQELDGGLRFMITSLKGPGDGPIGDSALSLDDGTARIVEPERRAPARHPEAARVRRLRRPLHAVLRRHLVADGLRPPEGRQARSSPAASASARRTGRCATSARSAPRTSSRRRVRPASSTTSCSDGTAWATRASRASRSSPTSGSSSPGCASWARRPGRRSRATCCCRARPPRSTTAASGT